MNFLHLLAHALHVDFANINSAAGFSVLDVQVSFICVPMIFMSNCQAVLKTIFGAGRSDKYALSHRISSVFIFTTTAMQFAGTES